MAGKVRSLGEAFGFRRLDHDLDRSGNDRRIVRRDQAIAVAGAIDLADPADIGGDQRLCRGGRLQNDIGQGFRTRRDDHGARARARALRMGAGGSNTH